jgi:hypothetical protein
MMGCDSVHPAYEDDLQRDIAAINQVLDYEAATSPGWEDFQPLLCKMDHATLLDRKLIDMIYFAKDESQRPIHWRLCRAHTDRLACLDLRNPKKELMNLGIMLNPNHALQAVNRAATALPPAEPSRTRAIQTIQQTPDLPTISNKNRLFEHIFVRSPYKARACYVNPADYPALRTESVSEPQSKDASSNPEFKYGGQPQAKNGGQTQKLAKPCVQQAVPSTQQGHMPSIKDNTDQDRVGTSIDRQLFSPKRGVTPGPLVSSFEYGLPTPNVESCSPYASGLQSTLASSSTTPHAISDSIIDPQALYNVHEKIVQQEPVPTGQQTQQPLSLQSLYSSGNKPAFFDRPVSLEWEEWNSAQLKKAEEQRLEALRKQQLRTEILAEIASGADILAYRYNEYLDVFPLEQHQTKSKYHRNLLANSIIEDDDASETARAVRFAKNKWWNYWTKNDETCVLEAMKQSMEVPLSLEEEMRSGGHLITQEDIGAIRKIVRGYPTMSGQY